MGKHGNGEMGNREEVRVVVLFEKPILGGNQAEGNGGAEKRTGRNGSRRGV